MNTYQQLTAARVPTRQAAKLAGVARTTGARRARELRGAAPTPERSAPQPVPANKLSCAERDFVMTVLLSDEFIDQPPLQVYAILLARGEYVCSVSTMYRVLREHRQVKERRRLAKHPPRKIPHLVATGPGQVYTWDITKLPTSIRGVYFDAYVMIDIFSRYIVGAVVHASEQGILAVEMMRTAFNLHGAPEIVHSDGGPSMTSKTVATLLDDLGVLRSRSRPRVSNDNPYSEALFKTMKYLPVFPDQFTTLAEARTFMHEFVDAYNHEHRHTGIGLHTPADVHYGLADMVDGVRDETLERARLAHPERFSTRALARPKMLTRDDAAWINKPTEGEVELAA